MKLSPFLIFGSFLVSAVVASAALPAPTALVATPVPNKLGLHLNEYGFSWKTDNWEQWQVLVATSEAWLEADVGDLWDSGRRSYLHAEAISRGKPFPDGAKMWWKVRIWYGEEASPWSDPAEIQVPRFEAPTDAVRNRIVLLGGSVIADMEKYGYFETAITARWPHHNISFRNLGWPGDDVFGKARGEFGSAFNTRSWQPPGAEEGFGFQEMIKQVEEAKPHTLIVGYGAETAFADSSTKMAEFETGYRQLIEKLEQAGARLILLTPIKQYKHGAVLPDPVLQNQRLNETRDFILRLAEERDLQVHDLQSISFAPGKENQNSNSNYDNGIRLNEKGHKALASQLAETLQVSSQRISGYQSGWNKSKRGYRWHETLDHLPFLSQSFNVTTPLGNDNPFLIRIDGEVASVYGVEYYNDVSYFEDIRMGPDHDQVEELRQKIIEKNQFHRFKIRPINKAYIFLFRRHEMGHLAYELEDFEELIVGHEGAISHLRVPRPHSYEIEQIDSWKSPRDYPDHEVPAEIPEPDVEKELQSFTVADGFEVNLFAKDPMIANPINLNWDSRGRAWVSTSSTYPHIKPGRTPNDRIVILEDTNNDGVADHSTVFAEGLTVPHSVMPVPGGAYVCSTTEFFFLADNNGDDVVDSRRAVLTGFGNADVHHMIHGLRWSPWGDLYFTQSIYINSFVDTVHGQRRLNGSGIWRFRPDTEQLEVFSRGMVNPWGHAFDEWGQAFGTDGAGGAGPHYVFPGSAFRTAAGMHRVLDGLIPGKPKNTAAEFVTGRHMPDHWQGSLLANDFRANRTVRYELVESGSGYAAEEVETVLHSSHRSYRPADIKMGPDGAVYVVDWYNPIIDHGEVDFHHPLRDRSHGRIWRITAKDRPLVEKPEVHAVPVEDLLNLLKVPEQNTRIRANRELVRQGCKAGNIDAWLEKLDSSNVRYDQHRLEALWLKTALNLPVNNLLSKLLASADHRVRAAAVAQTTDLQELSRAVEDRHPQVRLAAVNALRDLGNLNSVNIALRALDLPIDNNISFALELTVRVLKDQWLPALQKGQRLFDGSPERLAFAIREVNDPRAIGAWLEQLRNGRIEDDYRANAVLTIAAMGDEHQLESLAEFVLSVDRDLSPALAEGALRNSNRPSEIPFGLSELLKNKNKPIRIAGAQLAGHWKNSSLNGVLRKLAYNADTLDEQSAAARALAKLGDFNTLEVLAKERVTTLAVLSEFAPGKAAPVAANWLSSTRSELDVTLVLSGFFATKEGSTLLASHLDGKKVSKSVAIAGIRLAQSTGRDMTLLVKALTAGAELVPIAQNLSSEHRAALLRDATTTGDFVRGKDVFNRTSLVCSTCHVVNGKGGKLGPDLSTVGSYMTPESLLESLLNPNTDIKQGYETVILTRRDGTVTAGLLQRMAENATLIRDTTGEVISVPASEIASVDTSPVSLMPPGLTSSLRRDELVDLMTYLTSLGKSSD
jgi:putative heme-binding domain-containing protein